MGGVFIVYSLKLVRREEGKKSGKFESGDGL